ncbi:MAG: HAD hydrolase family protein [Nanoarchaeota archaeon]|nr:HAD hydrolase family protein [Nanoarchaeota archaeon]
MAESNKLLPINNLTSKELKEIKLIVFDVDGILVPRGTNIEQNGDTLKIRIKKIKNEQIEQIKKLNRFGFNININSGRGLYMLQEMFRSVLDIVSITYENGSATWFKGKIYQNVNSFSHLSQVTKKLRIIKHSDIKGFEPKEFILTIHCKKRVEKIEKIMQKEKDLYCIWNDEAYDIGIKNIQTKAKGLNLLINLLKLKKENVLTIGDNYNDIGMIKLSGISISSDKERLIGDFYIPINNKKLPSDILMSHIIKTLKNN